MFCQISSFMGSYLSDLATILSNYIDLEKVTADSIAYWSCWKKEKTQKRRENTLKQTDLLFDCLSHKLLIAKLHAYGFDLHVLKLIKVTYQTENKGTNLMRRIAHRKKFFLDLIFFFVICFG